MEGVTTIGIDLAKSVFQLHGVDAEGRPSLRRQLGRRQMLEFFRRQPTCPIGMEACASAHYRARESIRPGDVKAYVKRSTPLA
jgi:transposase